MINFKDFFPILTIDEGDLMVSKYGEVSMLYSMKLPDVFSLNTVDLDTLSSFFASEIKNLPEGTIIHKQDFFLKKSITEPLTSSTAYLPKSDNIFFYEKPLLEHYCYLILSFNRKDKKGKRNYETIQDFIKKAKIFVEKLNLSDFFEVKQLEKEGIIMLLKQYFSLGNTNLDLEEDYEITFDNGFQVKDNFVNVFSINKIRSLPKSFSNKRKEESFSTDKTDFFVPFTHNYVFSISCNHLYNQIIIIEDSNKIKGQIEKTSNNFKGLKSLSRFNKLANESINDFLNEGEEKNTQYVYVNFNMFLWDKEYKVLEENTNLARTEFQKAELKTTFLTASLKDFYQSNCPGNASKLDKKNQFILPTKAVSTFLNFETTASKSTNGILFCDRIHQEPIRVDLWDEPLKRGLIVNRNRLIFGPSGTGKSFLINHIVSQYYEQGHHIIIMDIGNSYKKLCHLVGGEYLEYEESNPLEFNPFNIHDFNIDKKEFLSSLILFLWKGEDNRPTREEKNILSKYLDMYFKKINEDNSIRPCFNSFYDFVMNNDIKGMEKFFDRKSFVLSTRDFYEGGDYDFVLNSDSPMDFLHKRFIVFEMDNIKDHPILFPLIVMLLIESTMDKIRNLHGVKKSIFIDECWKPLSKGEMVSFIKYLYKTIRKFYGEVAIATQDVDDILSTDAGAAIINNTDTFLLLSHKRKLSLKDKFSKHLSFTEADVSKLYSTAKRQVFIKIGSSSNVYNLSVSPQRYACYTSNGDENSKIYETYNESKNMAMALESFIEQK